MPWTARCQIGLTSARQVSIHCVVSGAVSLKVGACSSTESQRTDPCCASRLTSTFLSFTRTPEVVTDSPASSGTSMTTGSSVGEMRVTVVSTRQSSPSRKVRSTRANEGRGPGSKTGRSSVLAVRVSWIWASGTPFSCTPSTRQPSARTSTRCGLKGRGNCSCGRGSRAPESRSSWRPGSRCTQISPPSVRARSVAGWESTKISCGSHWPAWVGRGTDTDSATWISTRNRIAVGVISA